MFAVFYRGTEILRVETPDEILATFVATVDYPSRTIVLL